jgi:hypothetical protein
MEFNVHLTPFDGEPLEYPTCYRHIVGSLIYFGVIKSDSSYSVYVYIQIFDHQINTAHNSTICLLLYSGIQTLRLPHAICSFEIWREQIEIKEQIKSTDLRKYSLYYFRLTLFRLFGNKIRRASDGGAIKTSGVSYQVLLN